MGENFQVVGSKVTSANYIYVKFNVNNISETMWNKELFVERAVVSYRSETWIETATGVTCSLTDLMYSCYMNMLLTHNNCMFIRFLVYLNL